MFTEAGKNRKLGLPLIFFACMKLQLLLLVGLATTTLHTFIHVFEFGGCSRGSFVPALFNLGFEHVVTPRELKKHVGIHADRLCSIETRPANRAFSMSWACLLVSLKSYSFRRCFRLIICPCSKTRIFFGSATQERLRCVFKIVMHHTM